MVDIGVVLGQVGQRQLHRLDLQVHGLGAVQRLVANTDGIEQAQRDQRGNALAIGRNLMHHRIAKGWATVPTQSQRWAARSSTVITPPLAWLCAAIFAPMRPGNTIRPGSRQSLPRCGHAPRL